MNTRKSSLTSPRSMNLNLVLSAIKEKKKEADQQNENNSQDVKKTPLKRWQTGASLVRRQSRSLAPPKPRGRSHSLPGTEDKIILQDISRPTERKTNILGRQVRGIFRAKNAFRRCLIVSKEAKEAEEQEPCPEIVEIKELPSEPRFASTLSVEAQYAIMKGYEDNVYGWLSDKYPDKKRVLLRNSTPVMGVKPKQEPPKKPKRDLADKINNILLVNKAVEKFKKGGKISATPVVVVNKSNDINVVNINKPDDKSQNVSSSLQPIKNTKETDDRTQAEPPVTTNEDKPMGRTRSSSLPCIPPQARLVMTNRYQIVMDIFDQLRMKEGVNSLSPRRSITVNGQAPVREYNTWSQVWQKDFVKTYKVPAINAK